MSPLWFSKAQPDGKSTRGEAAKGVKKERRKGSDRRSGNDRRGRRGRRKTRELYRDDLDRHLWSWASSKSPRKKREQEKKTADRRRKVAGLVASAAGAAGLSWFLYRRIRQEDREDDPISRQADLNEADFDR